MSPSRPAPAAPAEPSAPETPARTPNPDAVVVLSTQRLTVDGAEKAIDHCNIDGYNYFKLRDLACLLNGTANTFTVTYDPAARNVAITTGAAYAPIEGDLVFGEDRSSTAVVSTQSITVDGRPVSLLAYNIGGSNYFMLRDLDPWLGFAVDYEASTRTAMILTQG